MVSVSKLFVIALIGITLLTSVFAIDGKTVEEKTKIILPEEDIAFVHASLNISPERGFVGTNFSFDASGSYCEYINSGKQCNLTRGVIDFGDSNPIDFNGTPGNFYHTYNDSGLYIVSLKVCHENECDKVTRLLTVEKDRIKINVNRRVDGYEWVKIEFDGNATGSYSKIVQYAWDFDGDGTYDWISNTSGKAYHIYNKSGTYHAVFKAVNERGDYETERVHVRIRYNEKPISIIEANATNGSSPLSVFFNGSNSSDPDGEVVSWFWDFGDGSNANGEEAIHTFMDAGEYNVSLTVTDDKGAESTSFITINVSTQVSNSTNSTNSSNYTNQAPIANFTYTNSSYFAFSFTDLSSDPDGNITSWFWDFGDGKNSTEQNPDHIYAQETAVYNVTLTVIDNNGSASNYTQEIRVVKPVESSSSGGSYSGGGGGWVPPHKEENETIEVNETNETVENNETNESIAPVQEESQNEEEAQITPAAASTQMTGLATGVFNDPVVTPVLTFMTITAIGLFAFNKIGLGKGAVSIRKWLKKKLKAK